MAHYITFGSGWPLHNRFIKIDTDDATIAREVISGLFGTRWSFIYDEEGWKGQEKTWGYKKLWTIVRDDVDDTWVIDEDRILGVYREMEKLFNRYCAATQDLAIEMGGFNIGDSLCTFLEGYVKKEIAAKRRAGP